MNIPGTNIYLRPTLQEVITGYSRLCYTKAEAVHAVISHRLAQGNAHGRGNHAKKRAVLLTNWSALKRAVSSPENWSKFMSPFKPVK